jgi:hypothetical protein
MDQFALWLKRSLLGFSKLNLISMSCLSYSSYGAYSWDTGSTWFGKSSSDTKELLRVK